MWLLFCLFDVHYISFIIIIIYTWTNHLCISILNVLVPRGPVGIEDLIVELLIFLDDFAYPDGWAAISRYSDHIHVLHHCKQCPMIVAEACGSNKSIVFHRFRQRRIQKISELSKLGFQDIYNILPYISLNGGQLEQINDRPRNEGLGNGYIDLQVCT